MGMGTIPLPCILHLVLVLEPDILKVLLRNVYKANTQFPQMFAFHPPPPPSPGLSFMQDAAPEQPAIETEHAEK